MQVRDLIEKLQTFNPRSDVEFEVTSKHHEPWRSIGVNTTTVKECEVTAGPDAAVISISIV